MSEDIDSVNADLKNEEDRKGRLLVFIVAYNAEQTIESVLHRIPELLRTRYEVEVLVIDDSSKDNTFNRSELVRRAGTLQFPLTVLYNPVNQGYGGNQKIGFHYAIEHGFDWVALVHGDGQYAPECLPDLVKVLADREAEVVFGSRMIEKRAALKGGMPLYKYLGNKILTGYQNRMLRSSLSEFHSGYRLYSIEALKRIPFQLNSNDFHFDTEIIIQLIFARQRIKELSIPTFYGDEICHVNGIKYAWDVVLATLLARVQVFHIFYDPKFDCKPTDPLESESASEALYYDALLSQDVEQGAKILLVGSGGQRLRRRLDNAGHQIDIKDVDTFLDEDHNHEYSSIFLLDDSGFAARPEDIVDKLAEMSRFRPELKICVTTANIGFFITRLQLLFGRFAYSRKGVINLNAFHHFTLRSAKKIFTQNGFTVEKVVGLPVPYSGVFSRRHGLAGFMTSIHKGLIKIRRSFFSFQFILFLSPPVSLEQLLLSAIEISDKKVEQIEK